jgi:hypothetical protein
VVENKGVIHGWKAEAARHDTSCAHSTPNTGFVSTRSECVAKDGAVRMFLVNRLEGNGGYSERKDCSRQEVCLTYLGFRVDAGGAEVRIPQELAGRYELQVDSFKCSEMPPLSGQKVALKAEFLGSEIALKPGSRFPLNQAGLVDVSFHGNATFELPFAKKSPLAATTGCEVILSLQPRQ